MHSHASASISNSQLSGASCGIVFGTAKYSTTMSAAYPSGTRSFPARQRSALVMRPSAQTRYSAEKVRRHFVRGLAHGKRQRIFAHDAPDLRKRFLRGIEKGGHFLFDVLVVLHLAARAVLVEEHINLVFRFSQRHGAPPLSQSSSSSSTRTSVPAAEATSERSSAVNGTGVRSPGARRQPLSAVTSSPSARRSLHVHAGGFAVVLHHAGKSAHADGLRARTEGEHADGIDLFMVSPFSYRECAARRRAPPRRCRRGCR